MLLYTYISRFPVNPHYQQKRKIRRNCRHKFYPQPFLIAFFNFSHKRPTFAFTSESGYTRHQSPQSRTQRLTRRNRGRFGWGWYHYSRSVPHVHQHPRAGYQNGKFCRFWGLVGCSQRTQKAFGTAMRLCASLSRGVAAPLGCVIFFTSAEIAVCTSCAQGFLRVRGEGWYHYPQRALRAAETPDGRLSKRLICRFLRSGGRSSPHDSYFLANTQNFLLAVPVANAFALWYDKFSKLEFVNHLHRFFQF